MVWVLQTSSEVESPLLEGKIKLGETRGRRRRRSRRGVYSAALSAAGGVSSPLSAGLCLSVPRCSDLIPSFPETIQTYDGSSDTSELGRFCSLEKL